VKGTNLSGTLDQHTVDRFRIDLPNGPKSVSAFPRFKLSTKTFSLSVHSCVCVEHVDVGESPEAKYCCRRCYSHTKEALYVVVQ